MRLETPADLARLPWVLQQGSDEFDVWLAVHDVRVAGKHDIVGGVRTPSLILQIHSLLSRIFSLLGCLAAR